MKPFTMWVVVHPNGWAFVHTARRTRRDAQRAYIDTWARGPLSTWPGAYRQGYRCVRVRVERAP